MILAASDSHDKARIVLDQLPAGSHGDAVGCRPRRVRFRSRPSTRISITRRSRIAVVPARVTSDVEPATEAAEDGAEVFAGLRRRLFGIAYRVLGSWDDAEDVVQDVWVRWHKYDRRTVLDPTAFLVTTTTRLAITATQTARVRRERSLGDWTPERSDSSADPASDVVHAEELEHAIQLLMERLTPTERAAFVLREAFDYPYAKIACLLQMTEVNARQLVSRAGKSLTKRRQAAVAVAERRQLMNALVAAARGGDLVELEALVVRGVVARANDKTGQGETSFVDRESQLRHGQLDRFRFRCIEDPRSPRDLLE